MLHDFFPGLAREAQTVKISLIASRLLAWIADFSPGVKPVLAPVPLK
jgi:hypothetical protein